MIDLHALTSSHQLLLVLTFLLFCKTRYLKEEVNGTEPSLSVRVPWLQSQNKIVPLLALFTLGEMA
jgi:hypothetical protein